jgi:hypothetical protein
MSAMTAPPKEKSAAESMDPNPPLVTELLLLPSGEILVHNLTPTFADLLAQLDLIDRRHRSCFSTTGEGYPPSAAPEPDSQP